MNKDKEAEVVDSREAEEDLTEKVVYLIVLCRIKENLNKRMRTKTRPSGKVVVLIKEVLVLTKEEVIHILEVAFGNFFRYGKEGHRSYECKYFRESESGNTNFMVEGEPMIPLSDPKVG